ncbi:MAG: hypothetical protein ACXVPN_04045 [Bacteroidia bacterium]
MKKIVLTVSIAMAALAGKGQSEYIYKAKFEGVTDAAKATPVMNSVNMIFKSNALFNEANEAIEFNSKMSISQTVFNNMMMNEGYKVESFEKKELKTEAAVVPVETKKTQPDPPTLKTSVTSAKNETPQAVIPVKGTPKSK